MTALAVRGALIGASLTAAAIVGVGAGSIADTAPRAVMVNVYTSEDLSDPPMVEPMTVLTVTYSAGSVCYVSDRTGQDTRQLYTDCGAFIAAGGHVGGQS